MKKYFYQQKGLVISAVFINISAAGFMAYIAVILRDILDIAIALDMEGFRNMLFFSAIYFPIVACTYYLADALNAQLTSKIIRNIRKDVFQGMMRQEMSQFQLVNSADYISALTNDIKLLEENYLTPLINLIYQIVTPILSIGIMFYLGRIMAVFMLTALIFIIVIPALFGGAIQKRQKNLSQEMSLFTIKIKDIFSGFEVIKSYQINTHIDNQFTKQNNTIFKSKLSLDYLYALTTTVSMMLGLLSQAGTIFFSAYLIIQGNLTAGTLLSLVQVSGQIIAPIQVIADSFPKIKGSKTIVDRLENFYTQQSHNSGNITGTFDTSLTIKNLEYTYPNQESPVLKNIHFTFEKNKKYVLIGKSGCGKTTLTKALIGHLDNYKGEILYDQVELKDLSEESIGTLSSMIHQNVYMFDEDIEQNICLYNAYEKTKLFSVIEESGVSVFLNENRTIKTKVGENGANLSGGERQRIAVARALIQNKPILILDEGTAAIDKQTAYDIENRLLKSKELTLITITHSLEINLLRRYDEVIYMEDGNIIEHGPLDNLMKLKGELYDYIAA